MNKRSRIVALLATTLGFAAALPVSAQKLDAPSITPAQGSNRPADAQGDSRQQVLDLATTTRVRATLQIDSELKTQTIFVETLDGNVRLTGQVNSAVTFDRARDVLRQVEGVKTVDNQLVIRQIRP
jgi:hyperosmotically inducible periplasmic protein